MTKPLEVLRSANFGSRTAEDERDQLKQYMDANPQVHTDLEGIRQPLTDFRNRCQIGDND